MLKRDEIIARFQAQDGRAGNHAKGRQGLDFATWRTEASGLGFKGDAAAAFRGIMQAGQGADQHVVTTKILPAHAIHLADFRKYLAKLQARGAGDGAAQPTQAARFRVTADTLEVFESFDSWDNLRNLKKGDIVTSAGVTKECEGYLMLAIAPEGVVEASFLQPLQEDTSSRAVVVASLLREGSQGSVLRAWRRHIDPMLTGRVSREVFVQCCRRAGVGAFAAEAYKELVADGGKLSFSQLAPEEAGNLRGFVEAAATAVGFDLEEVWAYLDEHRRNWITLQEFQRRLNTLNFEGDVGLLWTGLTDKDVPRLNKQNLIDTRSLLPQDYDAREITAGLSALAGELFGGAEGFCSALGLQKGTDTISSEDLEAHLAAMGYRGDVSKVFRVLAKGKAVYPHTTISRDLLMALVVGAICPRSKELKVVKDDGVRDESGRSTPANFGPPGGCGARSPRVILSSLASPEPKRPEWDNSDVSSKRNSKLFVDQRHYFGEYAKMSRTAAASPRTPPDGAADEGYPTLSASTSEHVLGLAASPSEPSFQRSTTSALSRSPTQTLSRSMTSRTTLRGSRSRTSHSARGEPPACSPPLGPDAALPMPSVFETGERASTKGQGQEFMFLQFEVLEVQGGASGYKACVEHLRFYSDGQPIMDQEVIKRPPNRPWIVKLPAPMKVDGYAFVCGSREEFLPVSWIVFGSPTGQVWREVSAMHDYTCLPGASVRVPLGHGAPDILRVIVVKAKGLPNKEVSKHQGVSDPYCTIWLDGKPETKMSTKVIPDCLDPAWRERIVLRGYAPGNHLRISVHNSNYGMTHKTTVKDDVLAVATIRSDRINHFGGFAGEVDLHAPPGQPPLKKGAKIWLKLRPHCQSFLSRSMCAKGAKEADWLGDHVP